MDKVAPVSARAEENFINDVRQRLGRGEKLPFLQALSLSRTAKAALTDANALESLSNATGASTNSLRTIAALCELGAEYEQRKSGRATKPFGELVRIEKALQDCGLFDTSYVPMPALDISNRAESLHNTNGYKELLASTLPLDETEAQGAFNGRISIAELIAVGINTNKWFPEPHVSSLLYDGHVQATALIRSIARETPRKEGHPTNSARLLQREISSIERYLELSEKDDSQVSPNILADHILTLLSFPAGMALTHELASLSTALRNEPAPLGASRILESLFDKRQRPYLSPYQDTSNLSPDMIAQIEGLHREVQAANRLFKAGWKLLELGCDNLNGVPLKEGGKSGNKLEYQSKREIDIIALTPEGQVAIVEVKKSVHGVLKSAYDTGGHVAPHQPLGEDGQLVALAKLSVRSDILEHIKNIASSSNFSANMPLPPLVIHLIPSNQQERKIRMAEGDTKCLYAITDKFEARFNKGNVRLAPKYKLSCISQEGIFMDI